MITEKANLCALEIHMLLGSSLDVYEEALVLEFAYFDVA